MRRRGSAAPPCRSLRCCLTGRSSWVGWKSLNLSCCQIVSALLSVFYLFAMEADCYSDTVNNTLVKSAILVDMFSVYIKDNRF